MDKEITLQKLIQSIYEYKYLDDYYSPLLTRSERLLKRLKRRFIAYQKKQEMIAIATSDKAKKVYEHFMKSKDPNAFTNAGVIQDYVVDESSLDYNPMGGLLVKIVINNDEKLVLSTTIQEDATTGKYEETYFGKTEELSDLLTSNHSGKCP